MFSSGDSRFVYTQCQAPCDPPQRRHRLDRPGHAGRRQRGRRPRCRAAPGVRRRRPRSTSAIPTRASTTSPRDKTAWYMRKASALGVEIQLPLSSLSERQRPPLGAGHAQDHLPGPRPERSADPARSDVHLRHRQRRARAAHLQSPGRGGRDDVAGARVQERVRVLHDGEVAPADPRVPEDSRAPTRCCAGPSSRRSTLPAALPFFFSPEVFTHNGRSYIFAEVSSSSRFFDRTIPNQLAISGVDPLRQDARLLTNDTGTPRLRLDPEYFITAQGPFIYYNRLVPETDDESCHQRRRLARRHRARPGAVAVPRRIRGSRTRPGC